MSTSPRRLRIGRDGLLRMTMSELLAVRLEHLHSGVDSGLALGRHRCGTATEWKGYTEWASAERPGADHARVSIGWDWRLLAAWRGEAAFAQEGWARTNVMLVDTRDNDLGWSKNLKAIYSLVQSVDWPQALQRALAQRYGGARFGR